MSFSLVKSSSDDGRDVYEMMQEIPASENGFENSAYGLNFDGFKEKLKDWEADAVQVGVVDGWKVPQTVYWLYVDGRVVGCGKIRHILTDKLKAQGGNVGYAIRPSERGKGYGNKLLGLLVEECRNLGISEVLLTVEESNEASKKVGLANGGKIEKVADGHYYIWIK